MPTTNRKTVDNTNQKHYKEDMSTNTLPTAGELLAEAQKVEVINRPRGREMILKDYLDVVKELRNRSMTFDEIAEWFSARNISVSGATVRTFVHNVLGEPVKAYTRKAKTQAVTVETVAEPAKAKNGNGKAKAKAA